MSVFLHVCAPGKKAEILIDNDVQSDVWKQMCVYVLLGVRALIGTATYCVVMHL